MSDELVPEWIRVKREIESLLRGAWTELIRLDKSVDDLERRVKIVEHEIAILPTKPLRGKVSLPNGEPVPHLDED